MDILNFISWIRKGRYFTSVNPATTLLPIGLKDVKRDDSYLAGTMTVESLINQVKPYKVFTALLTQSGGSEESDKNATDEFYSGVTYYISSNTENKDFTIYGAPNSNVGTYFLCTQNGIVPDGAQLIFNYGAPVVTVLENTIGNIWFTYNNPGVYGINSSDLFIYGKTWMTPLYSYDVDNLYYYILKYGTTYSIDARTDGEGDVSFTQYPIEIRVYN